VISDPILENVPPTVCERPEHRRHMGADGLALRPWRAFPRAPVKLGKHRCVIDAGGVDIADAGLGHPISSWVPAWPLCERWQLFIQHVLSLDRAPGAAFDQRHSRIIYQSPSRAAAWDERERSTGAVPGGTRSWAEQKRQSLRLSLR
jgi:hypothetical protein